MDRCSYESLVLKIEREYRIRRQELEKQIKYLLFHWHTPTHGLRSREELESFQSYRELTESKRLLENDLVKPEEDLVFEDRRVRIRNLWFYKKRDLIKE